MSLRFLYSRKPASLARTAGIVTILLLVTSFQARSMQATSGEDALVFDAIRGLLFGILICISLVALTGWLRSRKRGQ
jgi:hypothetical protein